MSTKYPGEGYYPCRPTGMCRWGSKNGPYVGLKIREKGTLNETEVPKFSQNFLLFPKKAPYEGQTFVFSYF